MTCSDIRTQAAGKPLYLGIDPGRSKTGLALVDDNGNILKLKIAATEHMAEALPDFCDNKEIAAIVMGDGTNSAVIHDIITQTFPTLPLFSVGEAYSTEEARRLYWEHNPPQGIKRLIPLGLLVPPEPLDAYAAVVQVRRWLEQYKS